jgi:hypothetical protein
MLGSTPAFVLMKAESCVVIAAHLFSASLENENLLRQKYAENFLRGLFAGAGAGRRLCA